MSTKVIVARTLQYSFLLSGVVLIFFIVPKQVEYYKLIFFIISCSILSIILFSMKCKKCGVSLYFDPKITPVFGPNINLLKPAPDICPKCGDSRG